MTESRKEYLLQLSPRIIEEVRKEYNLDGPGIMEQNIDILHDWIQKQEHFTKKDYRREYLERVIISSKGSVERAKRTLDRMCTLRTRVPELFDKINVKKELFDPCYTFINAYLPKLTQDNYRIYVLKTKDNVTTAQILDAFRHNTILGEYLKINDYATGMILVLDLRENNIMEFVGQMNIVDFINTNVVYSEGFGFRIKNVFVLSSSKLIDLFTSIMRKVFSAKVGQRMEVVKSLEELHSKLPKELLPKDYGGEEKTLMELYELWNEELTTPEHLQYMEEIFQARVNEGLRKSDDCNGNEYLGIPGSFKTLNID